MKQIWIVYKTVDEYDFVEAVFTSEQRAQDVADYMEAKYPNSDDLYWIQDELLDEDD